MTVNSIGSLTSFDKNEKGFDLFKNAFSFGSTNMGESDFLGFFGQLTGSMDIEELKKLFAGIKLDSLETDTVEITSSNNTSNNTSNTNSVSETAQEQKKVTEHQTDIEKVLEQGFEKYDANGNGTLEKAEFISLASDVTGSVTSKTKQIFEKMYSQLSADNKANK